MPIEFFCSHCHTQLRTKDETAGKKVKCPNCSNIQLIPAATSGPAQDPLPTFDPFATPAANAGGSMKGPVNPYAAQQAQQPQFTTRAPRREAAKQKVMIPAILMLVFDFVILIFVVLGCLGFIVTVMEGFVETSDYFVLIYFLFMGLLVLVNIAGMIAMMRLKSHSMAVAGCIAAICLVISCCIPQTGIGIWGLILLLDPGVKNHFK